MRLPDVPSNVASLNGTILLGLLFGTLLFGVYIVQFVIYVVQFPDDRRWMRGLVYILTLVELVNTAFSFHGAWWIFASGWGDLIVFSALPWSFSVMVPLSGLVSTMVQCFFCWRISALGYSTWKLPPLILVLSLLQWAASFPIGVTLETEGLWNGLPVGYVEVVRVGMIQMIANVLCNGIITGTMLIFFFSASSKNENQKSTQSMILKLVSITVGSGLMTTLAAISILVLCVTCPTTNLHVLAFLVVSKIYSNTMLAQLNARKLIATTDSTAHAPSIFWEVQQRPTDMHTSTRTLANLDQDLEPSAFIGIGNSQQEGALDVADAKKARGRSMSLERYNAI